MSCVRLCSESRQCPEQNITNQFLSKNKSHCHKKQVLEERNVYTSPGTHIVLYQPNSYLPDFPGISSKVHPLLVQGAFELAFKNGIGIPSLLTFITACWLATSIRTIWICRCKVLLKDWLKETQKEMQVTSTNLGPWRELLWFFT